MHAIVCNESAQSVRKLTFWCAGSLDGEVQQDAHQLMGQAKRRSTQIQPKAVGGGIFGRFRTSINADLK